MNFWFSVEIEKIGEDLFKVDPCFFFGSNGANNEERFNATYDELLIYLQESFNTRLKHEIDRVLEARAAIDAEKEHKNKLWCFLNNISRDKTVAIKLGKNSYICFYKTLEWSKNPKSKGKFRNLNLDKIVEKILEKGLSEYTTIDWGEYYDYDALNSILFEKIPV